MNVAKFLEGYISVVLVSKIQCVVAIEMAEYIEQSFSSSCEFYPLNVGNPVCSHHWGILYFKLKQVKETSAK